MGEEFDFFSEYAARMDSMIHTMQEILDRLKGSPSASSEMTTMADAAPSAGLIPDKFVDISEESASLAAHEASPEISDTALPTTPSCGAAATPTRFSDASSDHDRDPYELWVPSASHTPSATSTTTQDVILVNTISNSSPQSTEKATMIPVPTRCSTLGFTQNGGALFEALAGMDDHGTSVIKPSALTYTSICNTTASSSPALLQACSTPSTPSPTLAATQEVVRDVLVARSGHPTGTPTRCSTPSPCGRIGILLTSTALTATPAVFSTSSPSRDAAISASPATIETLCSETNGCLMQGRRSDIRVLLPANKLAAVVSSLMASSTLHSARSESVLPVHMDTMSLPAYQLFEEMLVKRYIEQLMCMWSPGTSSCYSGFGVLFRHPWPPPICMGFSLTEFEELRLPWPPPTQARIISMGAELRPVPWPSFQCWQGVLLVVLLDILGSLHDVHDSPVELFPSSSSACPQVILLVYECHYHSRGGCVLVYDTIGQATWFFTRLLAYSSHQQVERVSQSCSRWVTVVRWEFVNRSLLVTSMGNPHEMNWLTQQVHGHVHLSSSINFSYSLEISSADTERRWSALIKIILLISMAYSSSFGWEYIFHKSVKDGMYDTGHLSLLQLHTKNLQLPWDSSGVSHIGSKAVQVKSKSFYDRELLDGYLVTYGIETTEEVRFWHDGSYVDAKCYNFSVGIMVWQHFFHCRQNGVLHCGEIICKFKSIGYGGCTFMFSAQILVEKYSGGHYVLCCQAEVLVMILWAPICKRSSGPRSFNAAELVW